MKSVRSIVGYGAGTPDGDVHWRKQMERTAQLIQERVNPSFKTITWASLRKATSESGQAATALRERVEAIQEAGGVALIIPKRIVWVGSKLKALEGLNYRVNGKGLAPHPRLTQWIEQEIDLGMAMFGK